MRILPTLQFSGVTVSRLFVCEISAGFVMFRLTAVEKGSFRFLDNPQEMIPRLI